jgi:hypothetical protein
MRLLGEESASNRSSRKPAEPKLHSHVARRLRRTALFLAGLLAASMCYAQA